MNRRDFLKWLAGLPSIYWPLLAFFERLYWTPKLICTPTPIITPCDEFTNWLINQTPRFDEEILKDMRLTDVWVRTVSTGTFPSVSDPGWQRSETGLFVPDDLIPTDK